MRSFGPFVFASVMVACSSGSSDQADTPVDDAANDSTIDDASLDDAAPDAPVDDSATTDTAVDSGPIVAPQPISGNIVVDQFGYLVAQEKLAVVRSPVKGFDAGKSFTPGATYALVDAHTGAKVLEAAPKAWNSGATDDSSGDKAWWFDFSSVKTVGDYFVLDEAANVRSDVFRIADDVYRDVLKQSVRMYFYQRDGFAKDAKYAGADWADGAAHLGVSCTAYSGSTPAKDLHGGWWDAGDQNKYTNWAAEDSLILMRAYREKPAAFFDDYGIPESGNGVPDVLDEVKWELDFLVRMQNDDGSVLSIVGQEGAKDPSFGGTANTAPSTAPKDCKYGPASTSATLSTATAFAYASLVFKAKNPTYAADLASRAAKAWTWANANPAVTFANSGKIGAGEQEVDDKGRASWKLRAAEALFEATGDATYRTYFDANYKSMQMIATSYVDMFAVEDQDTLLEYTKATGATSSVVSDIRAKYKSGSASGNNLGALTKDPYGAYLYVYTWGSNQIKADQGSLLHDIATYDIDASASADAIRGAARFIHWLHGTNPLSLVYLSNMGDHGAAKSITRFYHSWFAKGSDWDAVGVSKHPPPPGYLVGGPNPSYAWDGCCPGGCSGFSCGSAPPSPPSGQPAQKAYKDFNDPWPLDSWSISEPSDGYQARYVRLLSKFVQ